MHRYFSTSSLTALAVLAAVSSASAAVTLSTGSATINLNSASWATVAGGFNSPGFEALILDEHFDKAASDARTQAQIVADEVQASPAYTGQIYLMNSSTVSNLAGRASQATNFAYDVGNPTGATGIIGLGGVTRWDVNPLLGGGHLYFGDYDIHYDASRLSGPYNGTGWVLQNHTGGVNAVAFDIMNVNVSATSGGFSISGDLGVSYELANLLFANPADQGKIMGTMSFSAAAAPEPTRAMLMLMGLAGLCLRRRR